MPKREEEVRQLKRVVDPVVLQTVLLDELCGRMEEVSGKLDKFGAFVTFMGRPMTRMFKRNKQYQYATISAGGSGRVWYMKNPQPGLLVGIITEVANSWFSNTFLEWSIDYDVKKVEYIIGQIDNPKEFERGIPFHDEVEWRAYNNDTEAHTFEVLCDGFLIPKKLFNKIVR